MAESVTVSGSTIAPAPSSTPSFAFTSVPFMMATCNSSTVDWLYTGPDETCAFTVSSSIEPHTDLALPRIRKRLSIYYVASGVDTSAQTWTWPTVNVTAGWYTLTAVGTDWTAQSSQFYVYNGTDTSCLSSTSSSSSTAAPTSTGTTTSVASSPSPTSSATSLPVTAATSSHARTGAIVGGVIGGVVILVAVVAGYIFFGLCKRPTRSRTRAMDVDGAGQLRKWGGLSSRDSGMDAPVAARPKLAMAIPSKAKKRATTESTGAMLSPLSATSHGHSIPARGISDEDVSTIADEEKVVPYTKGYDYVEAVPPLAYTRRRSSASTSGAALATIASIPEPMPSTESMGRSRARSSSQSHRAYALAKLGGDDDPAPSPRTRSPPVPRRSMDAPPMAMATSPPYDVPSPIQRSPSNGGGAGGRRAARKPVPQLDPSELSHSSSPTPTAVGSSLSRGQSVSSTITGGASVAPSPSPHPMYRNESQSSGTFRPFQPGMQRSREDLEAAGMELPNLNHKSSFGDRQVHYLIPDMPPPPRRQ